ncbi:MAG TPA: hypothetical protein VM266_15010 [Solirubrobacteraceae bacterium]|nr:hypothetical protein [Solirubrobacteraceae bacterium]
MPDEPRRTVTFPTVAWVSMIAFAVVQIGLLTFQAVDIERQRREVAHQRRDLDRVQIALRPRLRELDRELGPLLDDVDPLRDGARRADSLVRGLRETDAPSAIAAAGRLALQLTQRDRLADFVGRADRLVARAERQGTVEDVDELRRLTVELLGIQRPAYETNRSSLATQRRTEGLLRESLAIQRQTLVHIRSIDRKTGGPAPAAPIP